MEELKLRLPLLQLLLLMEEMEERSALVGTLRYCQTGNREWYLQPPQWEEERWEERRTAMIRWRWQGIPCHGLKDLQGVR